jgi:bacterioferritin-associated ferredoxin
VIVCVCHRVSDRDIEREVRHGCESFEELQDELRVATACGRCGDCARDTFDVARACRPTAAELQSSHAARELRVIPIAPAVPATLSA